MKVELQLPFSHLGATPLIHLRKGRYGSTIIDLGNRLRCVVSFRPWLLESKEIPPFSSHCTGCSVGPRVDLDATEKKILLPGMEPRPSSP
jgi:hypothetical protein